MPSRARPDRAFDAIEAIRQTAVLIETSVVLAIDADDPAEPEYRRLAADSRLLLGPSITVVTLRDDETGNLVRATNTVSMRIAQTDPDAIIGNLGDDHLCRTQGWDRRVSDALTKPGIAYGDDLIHGEALPTAPFISASIVLALGYYALPDCAHMFIDNAWRDIAEQAGVRRYSPDFLFEHLHPGVGKAEWDEGYVRANDASATRRDHKAYELWRAKAMARDIRKVRSALEVAA